MAKALRRLVCISMIVPPTTITTAMAAMRFQNIGVVLPRSHRKTWFVSLPAASSINDRSAESSAPTTTPERSRVCTCTTPRREAIENTRPKERRPVMNAAIIIPMPPHAPENPRTNATTPPTAAPDETPTMYGSANGLRNKA